MQQNLNGNVSIIIEIENKLIKEECLTIINTKNNPYYVYGLVDLTNGLPFYIGKGKNERYKSHIRDYRENRIPHGNKHLFYKLKSLFSLIGKIGVSIIKDNLDEISAHKIEIEQIKKYGRRDIGTGILTNLTDGGEGQSGWIPGIECRKRMSISVSGKNNGMHGKKHSIETIEKIREKAIGRKISDDTRKLYSICKMGEKNHFYGKTHSIESRKKIAENTPKRCGNESHNYIDINHIKNEFIDHYVKNNNITKLTQFVNDRGIKCSRQVICSRLKSWGLKIKRQI